MAYEDARPLTLAEAKDQIKATLTSLETLKKGDAVIAEMNAQLKAGQTLEAISAEQNLNVKHFDGIEIRSIFTMQDQPQWIEPLVQGFRADKSEPATLNAVAANGELYGVVVKNVMAGDLSEYNEDERNQLKEQVKADMARAETLLFINGLYEQSKIETYQVPFLAE